MPNVLRRSFSSGTEGSKRSQAVLQTPDPGGLLGNKNSQGGGGGGGGSGTVTSVAAGAGLVGTPNPIIASGSISMPNVGTPGTVGDATHVAQVTTDAQGRVTGLTAVPITGVGVGVPLAGPLNSRLRKNTASNISSTADMTWCEPDWFNIGDYVPVNTVANFGPAISAVMTTALAYAAVNGTATVFFPQGTWWISSEILATFGASGRLTIRGAGRHGSRIMIQTTSQSWLRVDLSNGGGGAINNRVEVCDLGFYCPTGLSGGTAVTLDYGPDTFDHRHNQGSCVHDIYVDSESGDETGGPTNGIAFINCWGAQAYDCEIYGGAGWKTDTSNPGAGANGVGSGRAINVQGGTNQSFVNIYMQTWSQCIGLLPLNGVSNTGLVPQGCQFIGCKNVNCIEWYHSYANTSNEGSDSVTMTDFQIDNGNNVQTHRIFFWAEGGAFGMRLQCENGLCLTNGGDGYVKLDGFSVCSFVNVQFNNAGAATANPAIWLTGVSNVNKFLGCEFGGGAIEFDAAAGLNQINNTRSSVISDAGTGNLTLATCF